jgi:processive 1,2-diacylglycerol beta-glucosyltransferase
MRVIIYSVSAGAGHVRAAEAMLAAFQKFHPGVHAEHVDVMKLVPPTFKKAYVDSYLSLVNALPSVWGWLYSKADRMPQDSAMTSVRKFVQKLNTRAIIDHAAEFKPDVILTSHFLPAEIFSDLKKKKPNHPAAQAKLAVAITDNDVHQLWLYSHVDRYYAASDEIAFQLAEREVPKEVIKATGIPCDPVFSGLLDEPAKQRLKKTLGVPDAPSPVLLMNAHGCGLKGAGAAESLAEVLNEVLVSGGPKTMLVICGRNEVIQNTLDKTLKVPAGCVVKTFGYVTNMHELMGVSDLTVTKPGGLTTSECLARNLPMVLVSPIPGQEERNAEMLLENGCAVLARTPAALQYKLTALLNSPPRLSKMREACKKTGKPRAAADIAADVIELAGRR